MPAPPPPAKGAQQSSPAVENNLGPLSPVGSLVLPSKTGELFSAEIPAQKRNYTSRSGLSGNLILSEGNQGKAQPINSVIHRQTRCFSSATMKGGGQGEREENLSFM